MTGKVLWKLFLNNLISSFPFFLAHYICWVSSSFLFLRMVKAIFFIALIIWLLRWLELKHILYVFFIHYSPVFSSWILSLFRHAIIKMLNEQQARVLLSGSCLHDMTVHLMHREEVPGVQPYAAGEILGCWIGRHCLDPACICRTCWYIQGGNRVFRNPSSSMQSERVLHKPSVEQCDSHHLHVTKRKAEKLRFTNTSGWARKPSAPGIPAPVVNACICLSAGSSATHW